MKFRLAGFWIEGWIIGGHAVLLVLMISINSISNYSPAVYLLAAIASATAIGYLQLAERKEDIKSYHHFLLLKTNRIFAFILFFILYPTVTLLYSKNPIYGSEKILFLVISIIPMIYYSGFLLFSADIKKRERLLYYLLTLALLFSFVSILLQPYQPGTLYTFSSGRWSHVTAGRFLTLILTLAVWSFLGNQSKGIRYLEILTIIFGIFALYQMSFRAGVLWMTIVTLIILVYSILKKRFTVAKLIQSILMFAIIITLFLTIEQRIPFTDQRYEALGKLITGKKETGDGAIKDRIKGAEAALQMIEHSPFKGTGFGGYNSIYGNNQVPAIIRYPHNLFLEIFAELGIIYGIFFTILIFYSLIYLLRQRQTELLLLLATFIWLALFSKNFSSNGGVWVISALCFLQLLSGTSAWRRS